MRVLNDEGEEKNHKAKENLRFTLMSFCENSLISEIFFITIFK